MHHKHKKARIVMLASLQEPAQPQARMHHKRKHARNINPRFWRLPGGLRLLSSASLGGSLFCSWTCPEQGSHTVVLDGSLFEKEQGGHTFALEPHGAATARCPIPRVKEVEVAAANGVHAVLVAAARCSLLNHHHLHQRL